MRMIICAFSPDAKARPKSLIASLRASLSDCLGDAFERQPGRVSNQAFDILVRDGGTAKAEKRELLDFGSRQRAVGAKPALQKRARITLDRETKTTRGLPRSACRCRRRCRDSRRRRSTRAWDSKSDAKSVVGFEVARFDDQQAFKWSRREKRLQKRC